MITRCLAFLLFFSPLLVFADEDSERFTLCERPSAEPFCRRWQKMFDLRRISDEVYLCLSYIDPQPLEDFTPFRETDLAPDFLRQSESVLKTVFRKEVNPLADDVKASRRCLNKNGNYSLLLYEWENRDYRLRLTHNIRGLLLKIQPKKGPFDPKKGVPAEQVAAMLKSLLNLEAADKNGRRAVPEGSSVERAFRLTKQVTRGEAFHNMPLGDPEYKRDLILHRYGALMEKQKWPSCIVGFLSTDSLYVAIPIRPRLYPLWKGEDNYYIYPDVDSLSAKYRRRWREMFGLRRPIPDEVAVCLAYVDPRPNKDFLPFRQEQLSEGFLSSYKNHTWMDETEFSFMGKTLHKEANPYANKIKPSKYYLSKPGESDLLLYEWENRDFRFQLTESCRGLLLVARPKKGPFDPDKGVSAERVANLLKCLINLDAVDKDEQGAVPKDWSVERAFHLPKRVSCGVPFDNMPRDDLWYKQLPELYARLSPVWPRCICGFLSTDAICVVIPKCVGIGASIIAIPFDADWLRGGLVGMDGKTPLHKPLIERPWPSRGK